MDKCFYCFEDIPQGSNVCPKCGKVRKTEPEEPVYLYPGTVLRGKYIIGMTVGAGGFGVIYKAWDMHHKVVVAIKEFYSGSLMMRVAGDAKVYVNEKNGEEFEYRKNRFLAEAQGMAKVASHKNTPNVFDQFEENNTAYIVMELLEGKSLSAYMKEQGRAVDIAFATYVINEVGNALNALHKIGIIHRDVAPDNIFICSGKELKIKLLDFGAAKLAEGVEDVVDKIMKPGYTPVEQYENMNMGPWTDVYALGATMYAMVTNVKPNESTDRKIEDEVRNPREINPDIPENLSNAIMKAMAIDAHMRFQSVSEFLKAINGEKKVLTQDKERKKRKRRRRNSIFVMILLLLVVGTLVFSMYRQNKSVGTLEDATITIWYVSDSGNEDMQMQNAVQKFKNEYPNVEVKLESFSESDYETALRKAAEENSMPDLFESTGVSQDILDKAVTLNDILKTKHAKECDYLDQYYYYYEECKKIPLGFEIPVAYVIVSGVTQLDYTDRYFSSLSELCDDSEMAYDVRYEEMLDKNFDISVKNSIYGFMDNENNTLAVMISSSTEMESVKYTLDRYKKNYVFYDGKEMYGNFIYEWSVCSNSENQEEAAKCFLSWMLSEDYQNMLMTEGQLPLNMDALEEKCKKNSDNQAANEYEALSKLLDNIVFEK